MKSIIQKAIIKAKIFKDKAMFVLHDNSGQGSVETAIICEPFSLEWEV